MRSTTAIATSATGASNGATSPPTGGSTHAPHNGDQEHPGRMHLCQRHYAFQLEENINAILHAPEYAAAQTDEQRRLIVFRYIIAFGRE